MAFLSPFWISDFCFFLFIKENYFYFFLDIPSLRLSFISTGYFMIVLTTANEHLALIKFHRNLWGFFASDKLPKTFPVPNKTEIITILLLVFKKGYQHVLLIDKGCIFCFPDSDARCFYTVPHFLGLIINIRGLRILLSLWCFSILGLCLSVKSNGIQEFHKESIFNTFWTMNKGVGFFNVLRNCTGTAYT